METLGIKDSAEKISEEEYGERVKRNLQSTMTREEDGRYLVKLPWINELIELPSNREVVVNRLITITDKLMKQGNFDSYDQVFQDWEREKLIEVHQDKSGKQHFLPHRPVYKLESTTPIRPLFDACVASGKLRPLISVWKKDLTCFS